MRELIYCLFKKKLFILCVFSCCFSASLFAIISLFSFSFYVTYFRSKMDVSEIEACELP